MRSGRSRQVAAALGALGVALGLVAPAPAASPETHRTETVTLRALPADRAAALHERVLGAAPGSEVVPAPGGRRLVVRDTPERLAAFRALLAELDRPGRGDLRLYVRPVRHRPASELAALAAEVLGEAAPAALVPDDRAGQLVVQATWPAYQRLDRLLRRLDAPPGAVPAGRGVRVTPGPRLPLDVERRP